MRLTALTENIDIFGVDADDQWGHRYINKGYWVRDQEQDGRLGIVTSGGASYVMVWFGSAVGRETMERNTQTLDIVQPEVVVKMTELPRDEELLVSQRVAGRVPIRPGTFVKVGGRFGATSHQLRSKPIENTIPVWFGELSGRDPILELVWLEHVISRWW